MIHRSLALSALRGAAVAIALAAVPVAVAAQPASAPAPVDETVRGPAGVAVLPQEARPTRAKPLKFVQMAKATTIGQVVGSDETFDPQRLPATFAAELENGRFCTVTLIGPKVLLTAAHCVDLNFLENQAWQAAGGSIELTDGGGAVIRNCDMAPAYTKSDYTSESVRNTDDFALCELASSLKASQPIETISLDARKVAAGRELMLAGFGCSERDLKNGRITAKTPTSGILLAGMNTIRTGGPSGWIDLQGKVGTKKAIICPGDSGGAAYADASTAAGSLDGWRVVAVNSAVGPLDRQRNTGEYLSYLAPLADPAFKDFLTLWSAKRPNARRVCGVQLSHLNSSCRK